MSWKVSHSYTTVTPRHVALMCVQRVVKFCHMSSLARHSRRTIPLRFVNAVHIWGTFEHVTTRSDMLGRQKSSEHAQDFFS